mgnify:CR=1 FL=1
MAKIRQKIGKNWQKYDQNMAEIWQKYGKNIIRQNLFFPKFLLISKMNISEIFELLFFLNPTILGG